MATGGAGDDQEALFHPSPCALYYVQSPSATSNAHSHPSADSTALLSPFPNEASSDDGRHHRPRLALSRCTSSRGSNNSFLQEKKTASDGRSRSSTGGRQVLRIVTGAAAEDGEGGGRGGLWRFVSVDPLASGCCITIQVAWRLAVSIGFALFVFYLATKPTPPKVSVQIEKMEQFTLGQGVDRTGVITTILSCNCSVSIEIDNYSKVFGLHVRPPMSEMAFGRMEFASSQGEESYAESVSSLTTKLYVGAKNKPMYGAGRSMQDLLESGQGLPIVIRVKSRSGYRVVWNLIRLWYHHHAECLLFLTSAYQTLTYNSTCSVSSYHA